jgi:pyruvate dehydrogenase E2 component (dihydrolipoamide acetyltransferase)
MREIEVPMPKLSMTMEEGELIAWVKQEGDQVRAGDVLCEVNSDKVEMEVESPADGTLVRHTASEGDVVPVGAPIAMLATEAEDLLGGVLGPADGSDGGGDGAAATADAPAAPAEAAPAAVAPEPAQAGDGPRPVVPAARRRAAELGVDLATVAGTGRDGVVRVADVEAAAAPAPEAPTPVAAAADVVEVPLSSMRRVVARRLVESMQSTPHFYLTTAIDAEALLGFRAELNHQLDSELTVSVNDLVVKACAVLLRATPELNVSFGGDKLLRHQRVHVGIAVAVEGGLVVPVVRDADHKTLTQVAREARELIGRARAGQLAADDIGGGTFTVSNLGMFGVEQFTAVINPPEAAILAVGAALPEPVATADGIQVHRRMRVTLSIDHRALDGATGARFLQQLKGALEHPLQIVA